ncbi:hypothetical protein Bcav_0710 [Beutenbergia cavernae DSM 12333]|uniref:STAS domain-containing protein n=1 Tax=Beutenbergia cavernae (strain ATCC BAA-8 / DSM 12333 / CCUG 43141 / JCM 11478 / NBRC 16432 / NCIMB 13614 / HKI 0122) TaxID=471853 RepID=C5BYL3_BEUC1|nr:hypothetical protein [Beutenbergia cavernae]ACQ78971.1 hypothetical protein Bcav_0710 [Beutenbergia cavernae DSM 12333]
MAVTTQSPSGWFTATVRPVGDLGRADAVRMHDVLAALAPSADVVVLDLEAARLRGRRAAAVVEEAASELASRGGALLCVHVSEADGLVLALCAPTAVCLGPRV